MARSLSVFRRRPKVVDLNLRARPGIKEYQFKAAANFDAAFVLFDTVPFGGKMSAGIVDSGPDNGQFRGLTRFIFNPADYTATVPAVDDTKPFWISIAPVTFAGVVGPAEAPHLILPFSSTPNRGYNLTGTVGTSVTELQLPLQTSSSLIEVDGVDNMFISFEPDSYEFRIPSLASDFMNFQNSFPTFSQLFLRGSSAATVFHGSFRMITNPFMLSSDFYRVVAQERKMPINFVRVVNEQTIVRSILIDKIDRSQGNFSGYAQRAKQKIYVPYSNPIDPSVKGYLDLVPTDEVLLSADSGTIKKLAATVPPRTSTAVVSSALVAASAVTSGTHGGAATTIGGTIFLSVSPDVTYVIFTNLTGGTQRVAQGSFSTHTAIQIVVPDAAVTIGTPGAGWKVQVLANSKLSNQFTL